MAENKLANLHKIHFIGIGGAGMSAIAYVLIKRGYDVSGSDLNAGHMSAHLRKKALWFIWAMLPVRWRMPRL